MSDKPEIPTEEELYGYERMLLNSHHSEERHALTLSKTDGLRWIRAIRKLKEKLVNR